MKNVKKLAAHIDEPVVERDADAAPKAGEARRHGAGTRGSTDSLPRRSMFRDKRPEEVAEEPF